MMRDSNGPTLLTVISVLVTAGIVLSAVTAPRGQPGFELTANELHLAMAVYADLRHLVEGSDNVTLFPRGRQARQ